MIFGVLKDIKNGEFRVIATPAEVAMMVADGHTVLVQSGAGDKAGFGDEGYAAVGAEIVETAAEMYKRSEFIAKVKEIEPSEYDMLREDQILFTCIHPAAHKEEVQALLDKKVIAFTAEDSHRYGSPNCEAAGKAGALMALESLQSIHGGSGKFVSGLAGAPGINVLVLGAGGVGRAALQVLNSLGACCTILDINLGSLKDVAKQYPEVNTMIANKYNIAQQLPKTDVVINAVKWPKDSKEFMIDRTMVASMPKGSVIADISNDYGAIETFRETTHAEPRYVEEGVVHYCVSNIPGAIANSTSVAYASSVLPHFRSIMTNGIAEACRRDGFLRRSMTAYKGYLTHEETSGLQGRPWIRPEEILEISDKQLDMAPPATGTRSDNFLKKVK